MRGHRREPSAWCIAVVLQMCAYGALASDLAPPNGTIEDTKALYVRPAATLPPISFSYTLPGAFAFKTTRGYYLTVVSGGGRFTPPAVVAATQVAGRWEHFRYAIQTSSGFYMGIFSSSHGTMMTTRRVSIESNEKFPFVMSGLGSPVIFH